MSRRIILERSVEVVCWRIVGKIAKAGKRTELVPVLLRAFEKDGTNAKDLAKHLLFESRSRRVVAERLLSIATAYGLLDEDNRDFVLTETGQQAIDTEEVFVPEDGAWTIWASDDPVLLSPVLGIEPWNEPTAYHEIVEKKGKSAEERRYATPPDWLRAIEGTPVTPATGDTTTVRIDRIADTAEEVNAKRSLRLSWNVGEQRLQLSGTLEGGRKGQPVEGRVESAGHFARRSLVHIARKRKSQRAVGRRPASSVRTVRRDQRCRAGGHVPHPEVRVAARAWLRDVRSARRSRSCDHR